MVAFPIEGIKSNSRVVDNVSDDIFLFSLYSDLVLLTLVPELGIHFYCKSEFLFDEHQRFSQRKKPRITNTEFVILD